MGAEGGGGWDGGERRGGSHVAYFWYYSNTTISSKGTDGELILLAISLSRKKFISKMPKTRAILQLVLTPLLYLFD